MTAAAAGGRSSPVRLFAEQPVQAGGQVAVQHGRRGVGGLGPGAHDEIGRGGQPVELGGDHGAQAPGHAVADHRVADGLADHETGPRTGRRESTVADRAGTACSGRSGR